MGSSDGWCGPDNGPQCPNCKGMFRMIEPRIDDPGGILLLAISKIVNLNHRNNIRIRSMENIYDGSCYTQSVANEGAIDHFMHADTSFNDGRRSFRILSQVIEKIASHL